MRPKGRAGSIAILSSPASKSATNAPERQAIAKIPFSHVATSSQEKEKGTGNRLELPDYPFTITSRAG